jgi:ATP-binding cassette subfamily B protein
MSIEKEKKSRGLLTKIFNVFFQRLEKDNQGDELTLKEGLKSLGYHYRNLREWTPKLFYLGIFRVFPDLMLPVFTILLPTLVVKGLTERWPMDKFALYITGLMALMLAANLLNSRIGTILTQEKDSYRFIYLAKLCDKKMDVDYDILESQEFQNKHRRTFHWIMEWPDVPMDHCISSPGKIGACIIAMTAYGAVIAARNPVILIFIVVSVIFNAWVDAKGRFHNDNMWQKTAVARRRMSYIGRQTTDFSAGKDIRLYGLRRMFTKIFKAALKENEHHLNEVQWWYCLGTMTGEVMAFLRDSLAYVYLIYQIAEGKMTVSDFVFYTSLVAGFGSWFRTLSLELQDLVWGAYAFRDIRQCFDVKNKWKKSGGEKAGFQRTEHEPVDIELRNVSFNYPGDEKPAISNINLKIEKGEKLALVGLNGAGKTTLVKLLCGFYQPTEGEILVNGIPIFEYDRDEYYSMISAVFQDTQILPVSIAGNISARRAESTDSGRVRECLSLSGLDEKTAKLPDGENTLLVKELSPEATDLSSGEKQKLLLARALYKEARFLILDEPTASLDPIAENDIYLKYKDLARDKTSLFISHRLSSTRFCDRIILMENGRITEEGTHDSLMEAGGAYAHMFEVQSHYYREEAEERRKLEEGEAAYV